MKKILCFIVIACAALVGCTSDEVSSAGDVYGIVSDLKTGAPVRNAEIVISPGNASTVSGSDGHFEFKSLTPGDYRISVEAAGYLSNNRQVTIVAGQRVSCDIHLTPDNSNDVITVNPSEIDFSTNELQIAATIKNESDSEAEWFLDLGNTPWLYAYPTTGRISGGKTHSIVFTANRARMKEDKSSVISISAFGNTHPLSLKCKQSVQLSSVMEVESLNVDFGEEAVEQIIRIKNISETDVNWTLYKVQDQRLSMSATHGIVKPGNSQIVTIRLDRSELTDVLATTFMISDGTVDQPVNVVAYPTPEGVTSTNKIFYTSTDGNIVTPYNTSAFGVNIVSNEYEYGQGVITFDGELTSIGRNAFNDCSNLVSVTIPKSVISIGGGAFSSCRSLLSITIPESVTSIGGSAFWGCSSLTSINIPESVTSIEGSAFRECSNLTSITLPEGVTSIENHVFYYCSSLTSITIPKSVTAIRNYVFWGCSSLTSITLSEGLTSIGDHTFEDCSSLTSITIPESVTSIGLAVFRDCGSLTSFYGKFASADNRCLIINGVLNSFAPAGLTTYTIPNTVTLIGRQAFESCRNLTSINIPESVISIGLGAFADCTNLASITIPESVTSIGDMTFFGCNSLPAITIPESVTSIGYQAFMYCDELARVDCLPTTPPALGAAAFDDVLADCKIYVPDGTYDTYIAADGWVNYKDMIVKPAPAVQSQIFYTSSDGEIVIPFDYSQFKDVNGNKVNIISNTYENDQGIIVFDGELVSVGVQAFNNCDNLISIIIPDGVTSIGANAFSNSENLTSVTLPNSVTSIGGAAFHPCSALTSINIPDGVTSIENYTFYGCSGLTSITIPNSVTSIGVEAFKGCSSLTSITIPEGVTTIWSETFYNCSKLASITIPESVTSIGDSAFSGCSALTSITIPEGVTEIGSEAFYGCSSLTSINIPDTVTSIGGSAFYECSALTSITIPDSVTSIESNTFYGCNSLASITLPESVTAIGLRAFSNCSSLTSITIPEGVTSIENETFSGCRSLTSITIPEGVTSIGDYAFRGCSGLTSIDIPDGVTSIGNNAFAYCRSLTSIDIPDGVTSIGNSAFYDCSGLTSVYCRPTTPPTLDVSVFNSNATDRKIYVPTASVDAYKAATNWSTYADAIVGHDFSTR